MNTASYKQGSQDTGSVATMLLNGHVAAVGGGVIGGGWIARFILMGCDVKVYDRDPDAARKVNEVLDNARKSLPDLYEHRLPAEGQLEFCSSLENAVTGAAWVSESVPEVLSIKQEVYQQIQQYCDSNCLIASSTSGFKPSELQQGLEHPGSVFVAHPFNPVYLVPLVELVGNSATVEKATPILRALGMRPLHVRKEIDAHIADRLLEAVWREGLWLVNDGVATTEEIDDAIRYGFGLRWAQMGLFETYRIAGGEAGMAHFIKQFGPALKWPWTKLMDVPDLTDELVNTIATQSDQQSGQHSIRELERIRDKNLASILRGLKQKNWGAGELLNKQDTALANTPRKVGDKTLLTIERVVPDVWGDYNGHMNDSRYGEVFSHAVDALLLYVGCDADYVESGFSFFTVNTNVNYLDEVHCGQAISVVSEVVELNGKKLSVQHRMFSGDGLTEVANCTQLLLHVDLSSRKSCEPSEKLIEVIQTLI